MLGEQKNIFEYRRTCREEFQFWLMSLLAYRRELGQISNPLNNRCGAHLLSLPT